MVQPIAYDPRRFRNAAAHYAAGRPPYAPALIRRVAGICKLGMEDRVLDLGCGPGMLAIAFAPYVAEAIGVDPEPAMLRQAGDRASGLTNVRFVLGSSYDLGPQWGPVMLVVMGRSFHWMDRGETLRRLDEIIQPHGAVALFSDTHPDLSENRWLHTYRAVLEHHIEPNARSEHHGAGWLRHEGVLLDSPFCILERVGFIERRRVSVDTLIDRALSKSTVSRELNQERSEQLKHAIGRAMLDFAPDGLVSEVIETNALLARRP